MNIIDAALKTQHDQQMSIRAARTEIAWTFTGETHVDAAGNVWHEATANGIPVWSNFDGQSVRSCYDTWEIDQNAKRAGREATLEEITAKLAEGGYMQDFTYSTRFYTLQKEQFLPPITIYRFHNNGAVAYVRGWRSSDFTISLQIGNELDFWA